MAQTVLGDNLLCLSENPNLCLLHEFTASSEKMLIFFLNSLQMELLMWTKQALPQRFTKLETLLI
jgi:hypothetical protein